MRERLFEPLGMKDTGFSVPAASLDRLATSYWTDPASGQLTVYDKAVGGQWSRPPTFPSGAGGLVSTIDDYLAFGQMMLSKDKYGQERILSRLSVELITTDQLTPEQKAGPGQVSGFLDGHRWGFGVSVMTQCSFAAPNPPQRRFLDRRLPGNRRLTRSGGGFPGKRAEPNVPYNGLGEQLLMPFPRRLCANCL